MCATYNSYDGHSHLWPLAHAPFPCSITLSGIGDRQQQLWDHRTADHLRSPPISLLGVVRSLAVFAYRPALCGTSLASRCSSHRAFHSANAPRSPCTVPVVFGIWEEGKQSVGCQYKLRWVTLTGAWSLCVAYFTLTFPCPRPTTWSRSPPDIWDTSPAVLWCWAVKSPRREGSASCLPWRAGNCYHQLRRSARIEQYFITIYVSVQYQIASSTYPIQIQGTEHAGNIIFIGGCSQIFGTFLQTL